MDSMDPTPWQGWDNCCLFSSKEHGLVATADGGEDCISLGDAFDPVVVSTFCRKNSVSHDLVFKAAWSIALGAYIGTEDVCFGGVETGGGHFLLRCRLDPALRANDLLRVLEEVSLIHRRLTWSDVAYATGLFDTTLSLSEESSSPGIERFCFDASNGHLVNGADGVNAIPLISGDSSPLTSKVDIPYQASQQHRSKGGLLHVRVELVSGKVTLVFPPAIWSDTQAKRMAQLLSSCITAIVAHGDAVLSDLDILPPAQFEEIKIWNAKDFGHDELCIHQVIADQVSATPNDTAVHAWDGILTYCELDILASQLAWKLYESGLSHSDVVAFMFNKSKWTVVALLAIFKVGGTATALNPDFPAQRIKDIIEITAAAIVLVGQDLQGLIKLPALREIVVDETLIPCVFDRSDSKSSFTTIIAQPEDVAFIQFTSGSTGKPKGVMFEHRTFVTNAIAQMTTCRINKNSRVLQFGSHSFDVILTEVMTTLMAGACVCVPSEEDRMNDLKGVVNDLQVTWMGMTPTLAKVLNPRDIPGLQTLILWGEPATTEIIETWAGVVELVNAYGPSEISIQATSHSFSSGIKDPTCLGKGTQAVNTWIVRNDNRDRLAPVGAVGELALQGPTVTRGYIHDPARTAESFKEGAPWLAPTTNSLHQRVYFTGDLARYRADGSLEIIGRRDTQVKIRGRRIELGEIECHIDQSAGSLFFSVVEVIRPSYRPAQKLLTAFISERKARLEAQSHSSPLQCSSNTARTRAAMLESALAQVLPSYSIPSLYLPLNLFPTNASGKADRKALRELVASLSEAELSEYYSSYTTTKKTLTTAIEVLVAQLWADVLGVEALDLGLDDNFFSLGGNSILAMRFAVAAREQGLSISVSEVLTNPRLSDLASLVDGRTCQDVQGSSIYTPFSTLTDPVIYERLDSMVPSHLDIDSTDIEDVALATDYQVENLAWASLKQRTGVNYMLFDFERSLDPLQLQMACERLVSHHPVLRTVYLIDKCQVYQVALKQLPFDIVHCLCTKDVVKTTSALVAADLEKSLDFSQALIKFWFLRGSDGVKRLIFRASHLQYDGVTQLRWAKELALAYSGTELQPTTSFPGYIHYAASHNEDRARAFWRDLLVGSSMTNIFDHSRIQYKHPLDGEISRLVDTNIVRSHADITIGTTIKAAWALVLSEMASSSDVVFGSVIWGRNANYKGVEHVAGACCDNIPVRVRFTPETTRLDLLQQIQSQYFEAVNYESFQYKRIVEECTDWRRWERLSTLVEYVNLGEELSRFEIGDKGGDSNGNGKNENHFTFDEIRPPGDNNDIIIYAMPVDGGEKTFIALDFCKAIVSEVTAHQMLDRLVQHIEAFHEDIHAPVNLLSSSSSPLQQSSDSMLNLPQIPMPLPCSSPLNSDCHHHIVNNENHNDCRIIYNLPTHDPLDYLLTLQSTVEKAWTEVLFPYHLKHPSSNTTDFVLLRKEKTPFYEIWPNLIAAVALARWYRRQGGFGEVTVEDVLENPDVAGQVGMLAKKDGNDKRGGGRVVGLGDD